MNTVNQNLPKNIFRVSKQHSYNGVKDRDPGINLWGNMKSKQKKNTQVSLLVENFKKRMKSP